MIEQTELWRRYLYKSALRLEKRFRQKRWTSRSEFSLEQELFLGFFSIRKIMESKKFNASLSGINHNIKASRYKANSRAMLNTNHPLNNYDIFNFIDDTLSTKELCNQFIHSAHMVIETPMGGAITGLYVVSTHIAGEKIYYIKFLKIIELFYSFYKDKHINLKLANNLPLRIKNFQRLQPTTL